jgi:transketolase
VLEEGRGVTLVQGGDAIVFAYGPVMLGEAVKAAAMLRERNGLSLAVVNLPWLNRIDAEWLARTIGNIPAIFTIDNHFIAGGQGDMVLRTIAERALEPRRLVRRLGVVGVPVCGQNDEVLRAHGLDAEALRAIIAVNLGGFLSGPTERQVTA